LSALPYQLTWATAWCRQANELVAPAIGLPGDLPVVEWPPTPCGRQPDGVHRKTRPLLEWAAGRPFARVDDEVTERDAEHVATHRPGTALLLRIDPRKGLRDRDFGQLERWARALAQAQVARPGGGPSVCGSHEASAMLVTMSRFDDLVTEGSSVPTEGWDFSWFEGRATEQRPSWGYARLLGERMERAEAALDVQTGGGEVTATVHRAPPLLVATEAWPPNVAIARRTLAPLGGKVVRVGESDGLPFRDGVFDLVVSRHPVVTRWDEVRRVLRPGGTYLSQQVGAATVRELAEFVTEGRPGRAAPKTVADTDADSGARRDPFTTRSGSTPMAAVAAAEAAGLEVVGLRQAALRMEFHDIAAVVHFLRKVIWIVPGFTAEEYRDRLALLHDFIERHGPFVAHSQRFLVEARRTEGG
jgi:SAM-dependent methyltransferase